ncbi:hypothetical protein BKA64DRAFT_742075 [Cadophora sp. MPI-SDFR-AT-0126]|nr:hypothetical protein BKA64DRAFT_742075 [Leotiomycetes sp. MPI-SDFR-AT-0126]
MQFTSLSFLSIATIVFYSSATLFSIFLCLRHGFSPNTGFIFLIFFSLIRISGAALHLASIHASPMEAGILNTAALVLSFTGVSPLLLAALGLVYRVRFGMVKIYPTMMKPVHLVVLRIPVMAALVLCDEGAIEYGAGIGAARISKVPITSRIGVVLFLVVSIATTVLTALLFKIRSRLDEPDQYILYAVAASLPFIFARVIYGFLGAWAPDPNFAILQGSVLLQGCMSILPEMIVTIIYSILGIVLPRRVKLPSQSRATKQKQKQKQKQEHSKTKIVLVKPWKVVDVEKDSISTTDATLDADLDDTDVDSASIQGRMGEDLGESREERFVPIRAKENIAGEMYLGIVTSEYLPPLTRIASTIVFDKL